MHGRRRRIAFQPRAQWERYRRLLQDSGERERRCQLTTDTCTIDDEFFFVRGCLEVPVIGQDAPLSWGVWTSLSERNFLHFQELYSAPKRADHGPFFGWLSAHIWIYPETLNLKTMVHLRGDGVRPYVELERTDHPLAVEQREGITVERLAEIYEKMVHGPERVASRAAKAGEMRSSMKRSPELVRFEIDGADMAVRLAGDREKPALLLIHGLPNSSKYFRNVIGPLSQDCFVIAPDLPGFGDSEPVERPSFAGFADLIDELLARLGAASFHLYLHDFGAAAGLHLATRAPHRIRSLIVQNANAHESGMGPQWVPVRAYWADPTPEREVEVTAFLTLDGTRNQYVGGVPEDVAARIDPRLWEDDWRIMSLPGRLETQRALVLDNRSHVARFAEIANYLARWQPPALMLWGRHDIFFELEETLSWMTTLPRMEAHILDGPHLLLETHAAECAALMSGFVRRVEDQRAAEHADETRHGVGRP